MEALLCVGVGGAERFLNEDTQWGAPYEGFECFLTEVL